MSEIIKFQRKPIIVEAMWFGSDADGLEIVKWITGVFAEEGREGEEALCMWAPLAEAVPNVTKREEAHIVLATPLGVMDVPKGVWLVRENGGRVWPFSQEDLDKRYDPHGEPAAIQGIITHHPES